ncbi:MAG: hypothetical protein P1U82_22110 [Verrucomicrobiales bacterium]|nr:hypothetical protein [Verrucomicrobiales bacterium]
MKKKALTKLAQSGSDVHVYYDLTLSLIKAHIQAIKHEIHLKKKGFIEFADGYRLEHKGRAIERLAVSFSDYASFQDRVVIQEFLKLCLKSRFETVDSTNDDHKKRVGELNRQVKKLQTAFRDLCAIDRSYKSPMPFLNCWFLSVPQLLVLLDECHDEDSFGRELKRTRNVTRMTLDYYQEYSSARGFGMEAGE